MPNSGGKGETSLMPEWLDDEGRRHGANLLKTGIVRKLPTGIPFVRYVTKQESLRVRAACLVEQGIQQPPTAGPEDRAPVEKAAEEAAYALAQYVCYVKYPLHPRFRSFTDRQIRVVYDYYVDRVLPGLLKEGFDCGPAPSWEFFVANFGGPGWAPHDRLLEEVRATHTARAVIQELKRLEEEYPRLPPDEELFQDL